MGAHAHISTWCILIWCSAHIDRERNDPFAINGQNSRTNTTVLYIHWRWWRKTGIEVEIQKHLDRGCLWFHCIYCYMCAIVQCAHNCFIVWIAQLETWYLFRCYLNSIEMGERRSNSGIILSDIFYFQHLAVRQLIRSQSKVSISLHLRSKTRKKE